jgi:hypothetical protein
MCEDLGLILSREREREKERELESWPGIEEICDVYQLAIAV